MSDAQTLSFILTGSLHIFAYITLYYTVYSFWACMFKHTSLVLIIGSPFIDIYLTSVGEKPHNH